MKYGNNIYTISAEIYTSFSSSLSTIKKFRNKYINIIRNYFANQSLKIWLLKPEFDITYVLLNIFQLLNMLYNISTRRITHEGREGGFLEGVPPETRVKIGIGVLAERLKIKRNGKIEEKLHEKLVFLVMAKKKRAKIGLFW